VLLQQHLPRLDALLVGHDDLASRRVTTIGVRNTIHQINVLVIARFLALLLVAAKFDHILGLGQFVMQYLLLKFIVYYGDHPLELGRFELRLRPLDMRPEVPTQQALQVRIALINDSAEIPGVQTLSAPLPNNLVDDFKIGDAIVIACSAYGLIPEHDEGPNLHGAEDAYTQR
jgi:hypothetical protein